MRQLQHTGETLTAIEGPFSNRRDGNAVDLIGNGQGYAASGLCSIFQISFAESKDGEGLAELLGVGEEGAGAFVDQE